ncbi:MAG TPA: DUF5131 family protein [Phycisphaerae bacterium]|nr:DUF5131 family protein [Phycisphaerae bacterium]
MQKTAIEWCDYTSNPVRVEVSESCPPGGCPDGTCPSEGCPSVNPQSAIRRGWFCTKVSAGCKNCYAERMNRRCNAAGEGIGNGLAFTAANESKVRFVLDDRELRKILHSRAKPGSRVFVGDMTDLFHPLIPFEMLDSLWAAMALRPDLTFMILTKRPGRMLEYLTGLYETYARARTAFEAAGADMRNPAHIAAMRRFRAINAKNVDNRIVESGPLPNVQLGVSVENQTAAEGRVWILLRCPAAARFVSYEPALGPVDLRPWMGPVHADAIGAAWKREPVPPFVMGESVFLAAEEHPWHGGLDGVIAGGESGPHARPAHPDWFRRVRDDCAAAGVPFFFKHWGEWAIARDHPRDGVIGTSIVWPDGKSVRGDESWEGPGTYECMLRVGRKKAGRILDGRTHDELPEMSQTRA